MSLPALRTAATPAAPANANVLFVGDALTVYTVDDYASQWKAHLDCSPALVLDLGAVASCDSLGIQLICAARKSAEAAGKSLVVGNASEAVRRAAAAVACDFLLSSTPVNS